MSKKSRGPNFSSNEKEILIHLIDKYKEIVGNKKTDAVTIAAKNQGWEKLTEEFNSLSSFCNRKVDQLKTCWDNLKRTTRKVKALVKRESLLTGGRPAINPPGPLQARIESLLGPSLDGLDNVLDSDSHSIEENDTMYVEVLAETETEEDKETDAGPSQAQKAKKENLQSDNTDDSWRNWTPAALKTKASSTLKRKNNPSSLSPSSWLHRRRQRTSLQEKVLQNKIGLLEILKQNAHREAELKTKLLEEQIKQELIKTKILTLELKKLQQ